MAFIDFGISSLDARPIRFLRHMSALSTQSLRSVPLLGCLWVIFACGKPRAARSLVIRTFLPLGQFLVSFPSV